RDPMITLAAFIIAVIAAVVVGLLLSREPGFVLIAYGTTQVEFTLFIFILIYLGALLVGWALWTLLRRTLAVPGRLHERGERRRLRNAEREFVRGTVALAEGHVETAETALERAAWGPLAFPALIAAAYAADLAGARERRDAYYRRALEIQPKAASVVLLTQSDFDLAHGDYERALASLRRLRSERGEHPRALANLARVFLALHEYRALLDLLPELERKTKLTPAEIEGMAEAALAGALAYADSDPEALRKLLPRNFRERPSIRRIFARKWAAKGDATCAAELLARNLDDEYDPASVREYAALEAIPNTERLQRLDAWLHRHPHGAVLAKEAGRLALELRLWGQARNHFEAALRADPNDAEAALLAGRTAEQEGRQADAIDAYRAGLEAATQSAALPTGNESPPRRQGTKLNVIAGDK
ncbi:MAG: heme biosynthesis HemY N-terminal domain-containing protein, partial [Acetobacteraceae bacterium]